MLPNDFGIGLVKALRDLRRSSIRFLSVATHRAAPHSRTREWLVLLRASTIALLSFALPTRVAEASDPALVLQDPDLLATLEAQGLGLAERLIGHPTQLDHNKALRQHSAAYRTLLDELYVSLRQLQRDDRHLGISMAHPHRLFDARWLSSASARFELAGVVNRMDRRPFAPDTCGEVRLIYRLRYAIESKGQQIVSRLPFTINLVSWQKSRDPRQGCGEVARRWLKARSRNDLRTWSTSQDGPLNPGAMSRDLIKAVEVNFQGVRWPSTMRPDLGAHAEYLMRVFEYNPKTGALSLAPLENTIDWVKLKRDKALKARLLAWLNVSENAQAVDRGVALIPEKFLTKRATSVSPRGLTRLANRPFKSLFDKGELSEGTLRRLDDLTCIGCHQARSVAGFHFLGIDRADTPAVNAVKVTGSPHFDLDLPRRAAYLEAVAADKTPVDDRPLSERAETGEGGYGSHCGLGDPAFKTWTCKTGLACLGVGLAKGDRTVGQCFPAAKGQVGDPCEIGMLEASADSRKDKIVKAKQSSCKAGVCEVNEVGFPDGMCAVRCDESRDNVSCGAIALLQPFNECLGKATPFTKCLVDNVRPAGLRSCGEQNPCRDDYLCAMTPKGGGACIPPYFLFQMRVDGHPSPY